jgi:hypothetical protein
VTVTAAHTNNNGMIIKYNSSGTPLWASSTTVGPDNSAFSSIDTDSSGNSYVAGYVRGTGTHNFGNGVTVAGGTANDENMAIVKYNSSGVAQWAKSITNTDGSESWFWGVGIDSLGNVYAAGFMYNYGTFNFGDGISITQTNQASNAILVKYSSTGTTLRADSTINETLSDYSAFWDMAVDSQGHVFAGGEVDGAITYSFGNGVTTLPAGAGSNSLMVKYERVTSSTSAASSASTATSNSYQIPQMTGNLTCPVVANPIGDSLTQGQEVLAIIQPKTFSFDAFFSAIKTLPSTLISNTLKGINATLAGGPNGILSVNSGSGTYWQVGSVQNMWYKTYAPEGHSSAIIIPQLQTKPSIIAFKYTEQDLIPIGRPNGKYDPKNFRLAHSLDGKNWQVLQNSIVDTVNKTVAVVDELGGYYMIVGR